MWERVKLWFILSVLGIYDHSKYKSIIANRGHEVGLTASYLYHSKNRRLDASLALARIIIKDNYDELCSTFGKRMEDDIESILETDTVKSVLNEVSELHKLTIIMAIQSICKDTHCKSRDMRLSYVWLFFLEESLDILNHITTDAGIRV